MDVTAHEADEQLHALLHRHHDILRQCFQRHGVFQGQPPLLRRVSECPGVTQKELAAFLDVTPASVAVSLRRMEAQGLVVRKADASDGRVQRVTLTPHGAAVQAACQRTVEKLIDVLYAGFTPAELTALSGYLVRMREALDRLPACPIPHERTDFPI